MATKACDHCGISDEQLAAALVEASKRGDRMVLWDGSTLGHCPKCGRYFCHAHAAGIDNNLCPVCWKYPMDTQDFYLIWDYDRNRYETYKRLQQAAEERKEQEKQAARKSSGQCIMCGQRLTFVQKLFGKDRHDGCKSFKD